MNKLEAIQKIRKLPKLKNEYHYAVLDNGGIKIINRNEPKAEIFFHDFDSFVKNKYAKSMEIYKEYFSIPITEEFFIKETKIVGYE